MAAINRANRKNRNDQTSAEGHHRLGYTLEMLGQLYPALYHYQRALADKVDDHRVLIDLGNIYRKLGRLEAAEKAYRKALSMVPDNAEILNYLAVVYRLDGRFETALDTCRQSLSIAPDSAHTHHNAGIIQRQLGNHQEAVRCYRKAIDLDPSLAAAHYNLGELYRVRGHLASALESYRKAIDLQPDFYQAYNGMGDAHRMQGNRRAAMDAYQSAIKLNPKCVKSYRFLAVLRKFSTNDPYLAGMESLLDHDDLNSNDRILLNFSLGKAYEDLKQYETAFTYIAEANRLKRNCFYYDRTNNEKLFSTIKNSFTKSVVHQLSHSGLDDPTPIFILGMPRSGTSLVEQILASHPDVYGAGELTTLDQVITTYGRKIFQRPYPEFISQLTDRDCREMGSAYVKKVRNESGRQGYITDKMPHNFLFIGMIAMILPQARIIHCVRDPMDTCLSIFKNHFSRLHAYAYDLCELGHYYQLYRDLIGHWHQITPGSVYDIHYEKLVSEPRKQIQRLLSFCRLAWNDQCLNFHRSNRPVLTASTSQARRALYSDSVGLWEKYKKHLKPLMKEILAG